jgi:hypothetical protein
MDHLCHPNCGNTNTRIVMKKVGKGTKIQAIKVPTHFRVKQGDKIAFVENNNNLAGKTKFIKHQPIQK